MDPLQEYLIQQEYGHRQYENQKRSLGYERSAEDIIGAGPSLTGVDDIEYPLLNIIPPGYKLVPWYLANNKMDEYVGGIVQISKKWNRPFAHTLLHTLGKGLIFGGLFPELYGGFSLSGFKKNVKKSVEQLKNMVGHPVDATKEIVNYIGDILPVAEKYAKKIVEDPISAPVDFIDYVKEITPYAKKHSKAFDKRIKGKGFCCSNCSVGKKCKGGFNSSILGDPIFLDKLAKRRQAIEQIDVAQDEILEDYHDAIEEGDENDANRLSKEYNYLEGIKNEIENQDSNVLNDQDYVNLQDKKDNILYQLDKELDDLEEELKDAYEDEDDEEIEEIEKEINNIEKVMNKVNQMDVEDLIQKPTMKKQIENEIKRISVPHFHPEDYMTNGRSLATRPIDRQRQCPELDIPYQMIVSYINFVYPQLPEYVRVTLTKNLYNSISK